MNIRKGDMVVVISGDDRGKQGRVLRIFPRSNRAIVERINLIKRHTKPRSGQQGGIIEKEASINISNLMPLCGKCNTRTRVGKRVLEDGRRVRICRKCGEMLGAA
ncbi:MAG TPA: 50S ribosomal protein L24 [Candidatus Latescibacteria bacterium]|nr:50S ribosomal protein L24 [Candidatus Latescibacterota bacterium]